MSPEAGPPTNIAENPAVGMRWTMDLLHRYALRLVVAAEKAAAVAPDISKVKKYFILSTPRTGSTLLGLALERNGYGWPVEWFNPLYMQQVARVLGVAQLPFHDYLKTVILGTYNPALNVFGVNFHVQQYQLLQRQYGIDLFSQIGFDRGYFVQRRNKVKQAYSYAKSLKTGFWSRESEIEAGYRESVDAEVTPAEFARALSENLDAEDYARRELADRIDRDIAFDDLIGGKLGETLALIQADLGLPPQALESAIPTERQSTAFDEVQLHRLLANIGLPTS